MKLLMENWRSFLNEEMKRPADLPDGLKVIIRPDDKFVWFEIVDETTGERPTKDAMLEKFGRMWGHVVIAPYSDNKGNKCFNAWQVKMSDVLGGFGPMLYDLAIEWTTKQNGGLIADRGIVSDEAYVVWKKYNDRDDVEKIQLDNLENELTPDEEDNCIQKSSVYWSEKRGIPWQETATAQLYKKNNSEMYDELRHAGKLYYDRTADPGWNK